MIGLAVGAMIGGGIALAPQATAEGDGIPTLGIAHPYQWAEGFGTVRPTSFSFGSTASSTIRQVTWDSWGDAQATGHGLVFDGVDRPDVAVTVVAFDLGDCNGQRVYRQVTTGKSLQSDAHNVCHG